MIHKLELTNKVVDLRAIFNIKAYLVKMLGIVIAVLLFFSIGFDSSDPKEVSLLAFITVFSGIVLTPGLLLMLYNILSYRKLEYIIREDGISSIYSFMGYATKDLSYLEIKEVQLDQTFFQKMFGLGSVFMSTNAISFDGGLAFIDIRDSEAVYREIQRRVALAKDLEKKALSSKASK